MSHETNVINLVLDTLNNSAAGGGDLGNKFIGVNFNEIVELKNEVMSYTYFLNLCSWLNIPLLNGGLFCSLAQIWECDLNDSE